MGAPARVKAARTVTLDMRGGNGTHTVTLADLRALISEAEKEELPDTAELTAVVRADGCDGPVCIARLESGR